ncbi:ABC transporter [Microbacterium sp. NPDC058342]|uniref:ABC transporter n=1 Tax=Microbacterium sp. NPDC058342 TaxID=3346454 RepID=UPI0036673F9A
MSDPEVPQNEQPKDIDDVVGSANEGLDAAAAARADVPAEGAAPVDPDAEAFAAAERDFPGTFGTPAEKQDVQTTDAVEPGDDSAAVQEVFERPEPVAPVVEPEESVASARADVTETTDSAHADSVADTAYAAGAASAAAAAETQVMPAEPVAPPAAPQPIFVQAPEPPRELGNRGAAGAIGLVATLAFAILYLGAILGLGALGGDVDGGNIGSAALAPLTTWSFWVPVVVFFLSFWLLGAFINRARWGKWVIFGLLVAVATYGGHVLGQLFQAPFWRITATESAELVNEQLLAPLAIAAFIFARELTIWFGAWVSRSGARKKVLNAEAQAEYERTLEAGPAALR